MRRKIRLIFGSSLWDGAYTAWQEIKTVDVEVDLPCINTGVNSDSDWHLLGGDWLRKIGGKDAKM